MPAKKEVVKSEKTVTKKDKLIKDDQLELNSQSSKEDFAKAGKRSKKTAIQKQEEEKKEQRKLTSKEDVPKIKPKSRPIHERKSKKYRQSYDLIDHSKEYKIDEAIALLPKTSKTKFDASVEMHLSLNIDPKHADQNIRDSITLPYGSGKKVRIAVYSEDPQLAKLAVDIFGGNEFLELLDKGELNFDVLITSPSLMQKLAKYAKLLGPRGLMPNPKSGTVTNNIDKAVNEAKSGKIEYRVDSNGIIHCAIGKVSFEANKLQKNAEALIESVRSNKPSTVKSNYIKSIYLTTTMGPSIKIII